MKKVLIIAGSVFAVFILVVGIYVWNGYQKFMAVEVVKYDPQLTIYLGGGNSIVLTSEDGAKALIVDTKMRSAAKKLRESVKAGEVLIVNTHSHSDHTGGNSLYPNAKVIAGAYSREQWDSDSGKSRYPDLVLKPGDEKTIQIGSETVLVRNMGRAHTLNDVVVYCKNRKLLVAGDLVFVNMHPALISSSGTRIASWSAVLDSLYAKYDIKTLVPGHGKVSDRNALVDMKTYFVSAGDAIGNTEMIEVLKKKYKDYYSLPIMSGMKKTIQFIENERKGQ